MMEKSFSAMEQTASDIYMPAMYLSVSTVTLCACVHVCLRVLRAH